MLNQSENCKYNEKFEAGLQVPCMKELHAYEDDDKHHHHVYEDAEGLGIKMGPEFKWDRA